MWSRARSSKAVLVTGLVLLLVTVPAASVLAEEQHGGAIPNSGNDMVVVQGEGSHGLGVNGLSPIAISTLIQSGSLAVMNCHGS